MKQENSSLSHGKFISILASVVLVIMICLQACQSQTGDPLSEDEKSIVQLVFQDMMQNINYDVSCKVDPVLHEASFYPGDFSSFFTTGLPTLSQGSAIADKFDSVGSKHISDASILGNTEFVKPVLMEAQDTIPLLASRKEMILRYSTIICDDSGDECVLFADRIYSTVNKSRFVYFLQKNNNTGFDIVNRLIEYRLPEEQDTKGLNTFGQGDKK